MKIIPDYYIPYYDLIMKYYEAVSQELLNYRNLNLENIYWYLIMGKYLRIDLDKIPNINEIVKFVLKCEVKIKNHDSIGFRFTPFSKQEVPDTWSTAYALVILNLLNRLNDYLINSSDDNNKKREIINFILSCKNKSKFLHCTKKCQICKKTSEYKTLFSVLESLLVLNERLPFENEIKSTISKNNTENSPKNLFRLINMKFLNNLNDIEEEELNYFLPFQRKDGGFNFTKPTISSINETFWIAYLFENYKYIAEYPRGNLYAFLVKKIKSIDLINDPKSSLKLMEYAKLIILLSYVWKNLIEELEEIIFDNFTNSHSLIMDINELTLRGGVKNAEYEIIAFINLKYNLALNIVENSTRFGTFSNRLDPIEKHFASQIYINARKYVRFDITEIINNYNRKRSKSARVTPHLVLKVLNRMIDERFFSGKVIEKKRFFKKYFYFNREQFIPKVITCNKVVNYEDIRKEKRKLQDVREDIYNMTREMKFSSQNIMHEVDSLIFAEEIELAEKRLRSNIKKALFDAEFFNKSIHQSIEEFEYFKAKESLNDVLTEWNIIFSGLQADFHNANLIMLEKIKESEKIQKQKDLLNELEQLIAKNIADLGISFDMFKEAIRKNLQRTYTRGNVKKIQDELENLLDKLREYDHSAIEYSQKIISNDGKVKKKRKKIIENWVSSKGEFEELYSYYYDGFKSWHDKLERIDDFYQIYVNKVIDIEKRTNNAVIDHDFSNAFNIIDDGFKIVLKAINSESDKFRKEIDKLIKKQKKLYLLLINLEKEWENQRKQLEDMIKKIREDLRSQVEVDKNRQLKEDFIKLVNDKINFLDEALHALENLMQKMLIEGNIPDNDFIDQQFSYLDAQYFKSNKIVETQIKECEESIQFFRVSVEPYILKWQKFLTSFEPRTTDLKHDIIDDIIKKALNTCTGRTNSNQIDIARVAKELQMNKKVVRNHVENMLNISKITGDLVSGTCFLILHDNEWRINKRLHLFIDGEIYETKGIANRMNQLFDSTVENSTFLSNIEEFKEISKAFYIKKEQSEILIEKKINELKPNKKNVMYLKNIEHFQDEIKKLDNYIDSILTKANKSVEYAQLMENQLESINSLINLRIHQIEETLEQRRGIIHSKNKTWLEQEFNKLDLSIKKSGNEFKNNIYKIWSKIPNSEEIRRELEQIFEMKMMADIINDYNESKEDLEQKILNFEYQRVRHQLEKVLLAKQDILNNHLGKIQYDIENKIEIKKFKSAIQKLHDKLSKIDDIINRSEKELKLKNKEITSKSKVFSVKNKYLLDRWEIFIEEYRNIIIEKELNLELLILENYIKTVINVFKDEYIPFNYLAREFNLKKDLLIERLITLIADNRLPGKIYSELEVYYEDPKAIENLDKNTVELIKASKVQNYFFKNKVKRILLQWIPMVSVVILLSIIIFSVIN